MELLQMIKELEGRFDAVKKIFGQLNYGLDVTECTDLLYKMRASLPEELRRADRVSRESDRIVNDAKEQAANMVTRAKDESDMVREEARRQAELIVEQARIQQQRMLDESEICRIAKSQAMEIMQGAEDAARKTKKGADEYAYDILNNLEITLGNVMGTIQNGKSNLDKQKERETALTR